MCKQKIRSSGDAAIDTLPSTIAIAISTINRCKWDSGKYRVEKRKGERVWALSIISLMVSDISVLQRNCKNGNMHLDHKKRFADGLFLAKQTNQPTHTYFIHIYSKKRILIHYVRNNNILYFCRSVCITFFVLLYLYIKT